MSENLENNNKEEKLEKQKEHIRKIYSEDSLKNLSFSMAILIFSLFTYIFPILLDNNFDFGLIFEIITFIFVFLAKGAIELDNLNTAKKYIIIAMIPIGWLIIYDFINLLANFQEVLVEVISYFISFDWLFYDLAPYLVDLTLLFLLLILYFAYNMLNIADGTKQVTRYVDRFYDEL